MGPLEASCKGQLPQCPQGQHRDVTWQFGTKSTSFNRRTNVQKHKPINSQCHLTRRLDGQIRLRNQGEADREHQKITVVPAAPPALFPRGHISTHPIKGWSETTCCADQNQSQTATWLKHNHELQHDQRRPQPRPEVHPHPVEDHQGRHQSLRPRDLPNSLQKRRSLRQDER